MSQVDSIMMYTISGADTSTVIYEEISEQINARPSGQRRVEFGPFFLSHFQILSNMAAT